MNYKKALEKVKQGHFFEDKNILKLANKHGWTVAHEQASYDWITEDKEILKLAAKNGWTVAHEQANEGWTTEDEDILKLADNTGWTVAHEQTKQGWVTDDKEILKLTDNNGNTVAHIQASNSDNWYWFVEDKDILKLANKDNWTVAHEQAKQGWITNDKEILQLTHKYGQTVAHIIASATGYSLKYKKLLELKYNELLKDLDYDVACSIDIYVGVENLRTKISDESDKISSIKLINKLISNDNYFNNIVKYNNSLDILNFGAGLNSNNYIDINYIKLIKFYKKLDFEIKKYLLTANIC
ncbi:hypothetical protein DEFDS_P112 (plasmid) [Deferribacter desulfuricans SSM1]|uniref:DUF4116 domain-containing protein n=1 Tax=Deferribacter desulfuricans (strain DSM 14783 / JCM 11476 / NBRC 101012 / SSM1) TaxID=639282 RepID=D3PEU2_DEFDS|nr:hypothetical protein [Deferribacter desulfuricans]BAI81734.1 hypothetical protein DEFDS_P112 [Deferribacter desulfuricans SSM1]